MTRVINTDKLNSTGLIYYQVIHLFAKLFFFHFSGPVTTMAPSSRTALIVMSCLFGVAFIGAIVCFLLFCKARKQSNHIPVKTNCAAEQL